MLFAVRLVCELGKDSFALEKFLCPLNEHVEDALCFYRKKCHGLSGMIKFYLLLCISEPGSRRLGVPLSGTAPLHGIVQTRAGKSAECEE